ncbi:hypothetical protein [Plantactinospora sp. KBS50]|uniref:hypothetical protein n=1 Tax=Plantactinospora sp. KBS50 TaxID=2024580 RepID=UPI000BAB0D7B|nr:hypothetical protein [Plantactinospora sp. KBS50]ASW56199.1 hypothetical protein CIK06_21635 [Plantactinospora sp. KBS50]
MIGRRGPAASPGPLDPTSTSRDHDAALAMRRTARRVLICRLAGLGSGLVAGLAVFNGPGSWLGMGAALAAPTFAGCLLAGVLVGEVVAARPSGTTRTAVLEVRDVRSYLPPPLTGWVVAAVLGLAGLLTVTSIVGSPDDQGRPGRSLVLACADQRTAAGPWPGVYYSLPIGLSVLGGLLAALAVIWMVIRRPRPGPDPAVRAADDHVRRQSVRAVLSACGVLAAAPLAGVAIIAAGRLASLAAQSCSPAWLPAAGWASLALGVASLAAVCGFGRALLLPERAAPAAVPADRRTTR